MGRVLRAAGARAVGVLALAVGFTGGVVHADQRYFTYSYEPKTLPAGDLELEQWLTLRLGKESGVFARWDLRTEIETGLTDYLTTSLYLNARHVSSDGVPGLPDEDEFEFEGVSSEWKWRLADPVADPLGLLLYGEFTTDGREIELEEKIVLGRVFGPLVLAANLVAEEEWEFEDGETERETVLEETFGASYLIGAAAVGVEIDHRTEFEGFFEEARHSVIFAGPAVHYHRDRWWATLTVLVQLGAHKPTSHGLELADHERVEVRLMVGVAF